MGRTVLTYYLFTPACFADEELPLDAEGAEVLSETFNILSLKEMKLRAICAPAGGAAGEEPEEENMATMAKAVLQAAQKKVVSQVKLDKSESTWALKEQIHRFSALFLWFQFGEQMYKKKQWHCLY